MNMARPTNWLGQFIEEEVRAVIAWKRTVESAPEVKAEQDGRFYDDGSNFRNVIVSSTLPSDGKVQISKILKTEDPVTLLLTDGFTRIKAKLSESAVAALEAGLDEKLDLEMNCDVVSIREATVESTPYGPSDGFIQLAIEELEYQFHLRKALGQPQPVEERSEARRLIDEIARLRENEHALTNSQRDLSPGSWSVAAQTGVERNGQESSRVNINETPKSQRSVGVSQHSSPAFSVQSPSTQRPVATQIPRQRKPNGPTLAEDGFEMEDGVNLSRPMAAGFRETNRRASSRNTQSPVAANETAKLLSNLLGKRKAEAPLENSSTQQTSPTVAVIATETGSREEHASRLNFESGSVHSRASARAAKPLTPPKQMVATDYKRRKVPRDQQRLLDWQSSWLPSVGRQPFPHPNVPIQLLNQWKSQPTSKWGNTMPDTSITDAAPLSTVPSARAGSTVDADTPNPSPSDASSDDEELPWSPSQKSPRLPPDSTMNSNSRPSTADKLARAPPDMSDEIETGTSPAQQRRPVSLSHDKRVSIDVSTPPKTVSDSSPAHRHLHARRNGSAASLQSQSPHPGELSNHQKGTYDESLGSRADHRASERQPTGSKPTTNHEENTRTRGSDHLLNNSSQTRQSPSRLPPNSSAAPMNAGIGSKRSPSGRIPTRSLPARNGGSSRPSTSGGTSAEVPPVKPNETFMRPSPRAIKRPPESSHNTPAILVKGTQSIKSGDDDMEMEVPRSLGQDPAVGHRLRRSEHFRAGRRREWIQKNYVPNTGTRLSFFNAYKKAYPDESIRLSDFVEAIEDVHPGDESPTTRAKSQPPKRTDNVLPSSQVAQTKTADVDGSVATHPMMSSEQPEMEAVTPSSGQPKRVLPWTTSMKGISDVKQRIGSAMAPSSSSFTAFHRPALKSSARDRASKAMSHSERANYSDLTPASNEHQSTAGHNTHYSSPHAAVAQANNPKTNGIPSNCAPHHPGLNSKSNHAPAKISPSNFATPATTSQRMRMKRDDVALADHQKNNNTATNDDTEDTSPHGSGIFAEFARAWKDIKPRGAFAEVKEDPRLKEVAARKRRLDVLSWGL